MAASDVYIRRVHPGPDRLRDRVLPAVPETLCTRAAEGTDPKNPMTLDHLTVRNGGLYAYDDDKQPWPLPTITLGECKIGDLVFLDRANWPDRDQKSWLLYEVVPADAT